MNGFWSCKQLISVFSQNQFVIAVAIVMKGLKETGTGYLPMHHLSPHQNYISGWYYETYV